ncbi:MAG: murein biosynthesis integral membrane protein MurJ [Deferribacterales bacterium]
MAGFVKKVLKSGLGILTSRVFGMVRDVLVAGFFGANALTDAFFVAFAIPNLFRAFFAEGALSSVFVPILSDKLTKEGERSASHYLTSLIIFVSAAVLVLLVAVFIFPEFSVTVFMPGYRHDPWILSSAASMLVILMPYLLLISICALFSGYLNIKDTYYLPAASTAVLNISMIIGAWLGYANSGNINMLCYGVLAGGVFQLLLVFGAAVYKGYRPVFSHGINKDALKTFHYVLPSLAGVGISQLNFMVGRIIASFLTVGSISYLYYANRLFQFPLGMFAVAVGTVTLTEISVANSNGDFGQRNKLIDKAVNAILVIMIPASAGLIILADPIISLIYGRLSFGAMDVRATAFALRMYSSGLLFYSLISVFSRIYYSDKDIRTPLRAAFIGFVFNVLFGFMFMKPLGHGGIALAASIAALVNCTFLYVNLRHYNYSITNSFSLLAKIILSVAAMSAVIFFADKNGLHVLLNIVLGCGVYYSALRAMKLDLLKVIR